MVFLNNNQNTWQTDSTKIRFIKHHRLIFSLIIVLLLHFIVGFWLLNTDDIIQSTKKPVLVEVVLLAKPKPQVIEPPSPTPPKVIPPKEPPKPVVKPKPEPPKPKVIKPLPKAVIKEKPLFKATPIATKQADAAPIFDIAKDLPKIETPPPPVYKPAPAVNNNAVAVAKHNENATCVSCPQPSYPTVAKRRSYEGSVKLRLQINNEGEVSSVTVINSSGHDELDEAALNDAKHWRFTKTDANIVRTATQTINFKLEESE